MWKDKFIAAFSGSIKWDVRSEQQETLQGMITLVEKEVIEKLIEEIPEAMRKANNDIRVFAGEIKFEDHVQEQLKNKWLNK